MKDHIYMPNEIFNDLQLNSNIKSGKHIAFCYSYYYYISYLYRYCEWYKDKKITQTEIKVKLQLSPVEKRVDYLIKKDGILDTLGYTTSTADYPVSWTMENGFVEFTTISMLNEDYRSIIGDRAYKVKYPNKGFHRMPDSEARGLLDGTFYEVENTHKIDYKVFDKCMNSEALGVVAFYIYGYISQRNDIFKSGWNISVKDASDIMRISASTFIKYTKELEQAKLISIRRYDNPKHNNLANSYTAKR